MLLYGLSGGSLGFTEYDDCASNVGDVPAGQACTLPDGSNIAVWNGSQLTAADGSALDGINASALLAAGWPPGMIKGAPGGGGSPNQTTPSQGSGTPWWATLTQALSAGVTTGVTKPGAPTTMAPKATWYSTPAGMGGIAVGLILLVVLLRK